MSAAMLPFWASLLPCRPHCHSLAVIPIRHSEVLSYGDSRFCDTPAAVGVMRSAPLHSHADHPVLEAPTGAAVLG